MSATGSVNLIFCFSSSRPFAPRPAENLQQLASYSWSLVVSRWSLRTTTDWRSYHDDFETPGISPRSANCRKHRRHRPNFLR